MKVGFIGLGNVGGRLAGRLLCNGFDLAVRDLDRTVAQPLLDKGAKWADSPKELAEQTDLVITCLPSPAVCAKVMEAGDGVLHGLSEGKIWAEMSTTDEAEVKRLGAMVRDKGAAPVDCPVSGGCHRAATGNISIFVGCERETFERVFPVTKAMGRNILHTGPLGTASVLKVVSLFQKVAQRANVPLEVAPMLIRIFEDGIKRYGAREWSPNIIQRLEEACGVDIRAPGFPPEMVDDEPESDGYEVKPRPENSAV